MIVDAIDGDAASDDAASTGIAADAPSTGEKRERGVMEEGRDSDAAVQCRWIPSSTTATVGILGRAHPRRKRRYENGVIKSALS